MTRSGVILVLLALILTFSSASTIDWTFWNDDDDTPATPSPKKSTKTLSTVAPEEATTASSFGDAAATDLKPVPGSFIDPPPLPKNFSVIKITEARSTTTSTYKNWIGPRPVAPDAACYRESHIMDTCPDNFDRHEGTNTCWAKCPIDYPVECGMECIRQNDDCMMEVLNKVGAIGNSALAIATFGVFQKLWHVAENVRFAFDCANIMIGTMRSIIRYVRNIKTTDPTASTDKILNILYQSHNVVTDLPMAIMLCTRHDPPRELDVSGRVLSTMNWILLNAIGYKEDLVSSWGRFKAFLIGANFTEAANSINDTEIGTLSDAFKTNSSCAYDLRSLTDRTWLTVKQLRKDNPGISEDDLRLKMQRTELVVSDIALVTNNCMPQFIAESDVATAYKTRDSIRKAFSGMVNDLVSTGKSRNGSDEDAKNFMYQAAGKVMISIAVTGFDMIGLMGLVATYLQKICGPTNFIGEIDDGTHPDTLGLNMIQRAFKNSTMSWTRKGDGKVLVRFASTDTKNVTVNIMSGGNKIDEVDVAAGGTASWNSTIEKLGGKPLYMDRWRPGFLGLPGTGGGSLLLWVPQASEGGHLELDAKLNVS
ncbi:hypothetical protein PHYSODRAFT_497520 [Phytophthora sojae]|uniref:Uncharacterized protein n=1 Tax=Phytophthora sojae (strain P6497) TaxID=1094619 RepID=G4Z756_PHYSP|nr:hypothetical protein PHYSODRAFT_497520 [Phytophthora sojae]EGZ22440.1 hypothetical protein PHYSODRAFT_497520 [Phytophthora sojae]|eukprot:XP_009525157.1 hypothetical protein PHYSODRAFT_497520 [Phytophthora sojae]